MGQCVYCGKTADLNTQLIVALNNGTKVTVDICDEHAEDATIKSARLAYEAKQQKIMEFLEQARALGITVQENSAGIVLASGPPQPESPVRQPPVQQVSGPLPSDELDGDDVVDTARLDSGRLIRSVGGSTEFGQVPSHSSLQIRGEADTLPEEVRKGKAKMQLAEGRAGTLLAIPSVRTDGTGTTRIKIMNTEDDSKLQRRFKNMAKDSVGDKDGVPDFRYGYKEAIATCSFCRGDGYIKQKSGQIECPKCGGAGSISVY